MLQSMTHKAMSKVNMTHPQCGVMRLRDDFLSAYAIVGALHIASLIAAFPCVKHMARNAKANAIRFWQERRRKNAVLLPIANDRL